MKREIKKSGILFYIGNYTPRKNEFERGLKYRLFVDGVPTSNTFETIHAARDYINKNYFIYL